MFTYIAFPKLLISGLIMGIIFGFLVQISSLARFNIVIKQLLLKDFTIFRVIISALVSGATILYLAQYLGYVNSFSMPRTIPIIVVTGGLISGIGLAISGSMTGYCPGTSFVSLASGAKDAIFVILGLISGGVLYLKLHTWIRTELFKTITENMATIPTLLKTSPFYVLLILNILLIFYIFYKKNRP